MAPDGTDRDGSDGRAPGGAKKNLLTAADMAEVCEVDLKTIHNWVDRDRLKAFRTPGRHIRITREEALRFLRHHGYPVPVWLEKGATPP